VAGEAGRLIGPMTVTIEQHATVDTDYGFPGCDRSARGTIRTSPKNDKPITRGESRVRRQHSSKRTPVQSDAVDHLAASPTTTGSQRWPRGCIGSPESGSAVMGGPKTMSTRDTSPRGSTRPTTALAALALVSLRSS